MATTGNAATRAEQAADVALKATGIAVEAKKQAERHAETAERLAPPDPHQEIVRELLGHSSTKVTEVYLHSSGRHMEAAIEALGEYRRGRR